MRLQLLLCICAILAVILPACGDPAATKPAVADAQTSEVDASADAPMADAAGPDTANADTTGPDTTGPDWAALGPHAASVDPLIGTALTVANVGNAIPGASVPFGLVKCSPDTSGSDGGQLGALHCAGYQRLDPYLHAFSHNHLQGTGAPDYGNVAVLPFAQAGDHLTSRKGRRSTYSHATEVAQAGYYAVDLAGPAARHELTASAHCGVHRTVFAKGQASGGLLIDLSETIAGGKVTSAEVQLDAASHTARGRLRNVGDFSGRYGGFEVFFVARFSRPWQQAGTWNGTALAPGVLQAQQLQPPEGKDRVNLGMYAEFAAADQPPVELQVCLSYVDAKGADQNFAAEVAGKSFDDVRKSAWLTWESQLARVDIEGATAAERTVFYSALYRAMSMPTLWSDTDGRYRGFDGQVHEAKGWNYYTDLSLWDTFRTAHPLFALLWPEFARDVMRSIAAMTAQKGCLPQWAMGAGDTGSMIGQHALSAAADAVAKGITDFDIQKIYAVGKQQLTAPATLPACSGTEGVQGLNQRGWTAVEDGEGSVSLTLEYAYNYACLAGLAQHLGLAEDVSLLQARAKSYQNLWDPATRFFRPRHADGSWQGPFDTLSWDFNNDYYVEGTAWQWNWFAPLDPQGLVALYPSAQDFVDKLQEFFAKSAEDFNFGLPGSYYYHGNEPDMLASGLFLAAQRADLADQWTRWVYDQSYTTAPDGLVGNDDAGTLSAWAVLAGIGLYPRPGAPGWDLVAPRFDRVTLQLGGKSVVIEAPGVHAGQARQATATWQGQPLTSPPPQGGHVGRWLPHALVTQGGVLRFLAK
jgi:predicted alpha-1,2-mannosidase